VQGALVALQGDHMIAARFNDLGADRALAAHCVRRHEAAFQ
jgi:hypothetical protein